MIYRHENLNTLARHFETIEDPRDGQGKLHRLIDIFVMTIYGSLWGHVDFTNMAAELKKHEAYFTQLLGLKHGVPSHDTFSAVFSIISPEEFMECFINWMVGILSLRGKQVAIDGKAVRAACEKVHGKKAPMLVNAFVVGAGLSIGQIRIDEKTYEIKGIPEMIGWLDLDGAVVSTDAGGCYKEIAQLLIEKGADFVLQVKDNQPNMRESIVMDMQDRINEKQRRDVKNRQLKKRGFKVETPVDDPLDLHEQFESDHSRIERRTYYALNDNACINLDEWPDVKSVGLVFRERLVIKRDENGEIIEGEPSQECSVYIMSRPMDAQEFACYARGHWGIENSLHWVLDDFFREDRCTARIKHATENLGLMRKIVFNLTKLDENVKGMSMKRKEVHYRHDFDAIEKLIFQEIPRKY
jgi:predicted transposase YbfD/YdcC